MYGSPWNSTKLHLSTFICHCGLFGYPQAAWLTPGSSGIWKRQREAFLLCISLVIPCATSMATTMEKLCHSRRRGHPWLCVKSEPCCWSSPSVSAWCLLEIPLVVSVYAVFLQSGSAHLNALSLQFGSVSVEF